MKMKNPAKPANVIFYLLSLICITACVQPGGGAALSPSNDGTGDDEWWEWDGGDYTGNTPKSLEKTGIEIVTPAKITLFARNQPFTSEGLSLKYVLEDGTYGATLAKSEYTVPEIETALPRADVVTVTAKEKGKDGKTLTARYGIYIDSSDSVLDESKFMLKSGPSKTSYVLGDTFNFAGMLAEGTYGGGEKDGQTIELDDPAMFSQMGYDKLLRGPQSVKLLLNGAEIGTLDVAVKVPAGSTFYVNSHATSENRQQNTYRAVRIKGMPFDFATSRLQATILSGSARYSVAVGRGLFESDVSGYNPNKTGLQTLTLSLDGAEQLAKGPLEWDTSFEVYVADVAPHVYFDHGYRRTAFDPAGVRPGAGYASDGVTGQRAHPVNTELVLSPVRFLVGYGPNGGGDLWPENSDLGVSYSWNVTGPASTHYTSASGEYLYFTPKAVGDHHITVTVTGRNYVTGNSGIFTASMYVKAFQGGQPVPVANTYTNPLKHFGTGQYGESGNGFGWSCGSALGYEVWTGAANNIKGNAFATWHEPGIIWVQPDNNGNGVPDETWYEHPGTDDDAGSSYKNLVTRRYAIAYFNGSGVLSYNEFMQTGRKVYWVDGKGRSGRIGGGWPHQVNLSKDGPVVPAVDVTDVLDSWIIFTGTILRDNGRIGTGEYGGLVFGKGGYADVNSGYGGGGIGVIRADGSPAPGGGSFTKVQTGVFRYGGIFGDVSTEIVSADGLPLQTDFVIPDY
jgi:hypothetical protein